MGAYDSYNTKVGMAQGGDTQFVKSGGTVDIEAGATVKYNGVNVTAYLDNTPETLIAAGALALGKRVSKLELASGGAVTLAAPDATCIGLVKVIEMSVDDGDVTLALTNVVGQSSGTTATFNDVRDQLVVIGGVDKWIVLKERGISLA